MYITCVVLLMLPSGCLASRLATREYVDSYLALLKEENNRLREELEACASSAEKTEEATTDEGVKHKVVDITKENAIDDEVEKDIMDYGFYINWRVNLTSKISSEVTEINMDMLHCNVTSREGNTYYAHCLIEELYGNEELQGDYCQKNANPAELKTWGVALYFKKENGALTACTEYGNSHMFYSMIKPNHGCYMGVLDLAHTEDVSYDINELEIKLIY